MEEKNYDTVRYWSAREQVQNARRRTDDLPEEIRGKCLSIIAQAVEGTFNACKEIYDPDLKASNPGSPGDRETDKIGLRDLPRFFLN